MLGALTITSFAGRVGERFRIEDQVGGVSFDSELIEVNKVGEPPAAGGRVPFSLVFQASSDVVLPQRIYRVEHADLGDLDLFLVPVAADAAGVRYEAVFA